MVGRPIFGVGICNHPSFAIRVLWSAGEIHPSSVAVSLRRTGEIHENVSHKKPLDIAKMKPLFNRKDTKGAETAPFKALSRSERFGTVRSSRERFGFSLWAYASGFLA